MVRNSSMHWIGHGIEIACSGTRFSVYVCVCSSQLATSLMSNYEIFRTITDHKQSTFIYV